MTELPPGVLTVKEQDAIRLQQAGMSSRSIALALGVSRGAVRDRLKNAHVKLANHRKQAA